MSWQDNISTNIIITTGDGQRFDPLYKINSRSVEYNVSQFNFPEVSGTLVDRRRPKGAVHTLILIFQGDDHIETVKSFRTSADDRRPWAVYHPIYGNLNGQPISIDYDPTKLSLTTVTVEFIESIITLPPRLTIDPQDKIIADSAFAQDTAATSFEANVIEPSTQDRIQMTADLADTFSIALTAPKSDVEANQYFNLFTQANSKIQDAADKGATLANAIMNVLIFPSLFTSGVRARLTLLRDQFLKISTRLENIENPSSKNTYEMNAGAIINAMTAAVASAQDDDFGSAVDVMAANETLMNTWDEYLVNLDSLQTSVGGDPDSYIPDFNSIDALDSLVVFSVSQLFNIALTARQERSIILEEDSNVINLTHRFYGITAGDDSEIDEFMDQNNVGLNELLGGIKKGRKILYYV